MRKLAYILVALLSCELWFAAQVIAAEKSLLMGVFPRRNAKMTIRMFKPLSEYLTKKTGKNIQVTTAKNFPTFFKNVNKGRYDIVHYNQLQYIESNAKHGYTVIAQNEEFKTKSIKSAIVVRKDSGINSVKDLKGKTILFGGGKKAFVAYVANAVMLNRAGLSKSDYITKFAKNPPNAAIATFLKQGDAAGIGDVVLKLSLLKKKGVDVSELKIVVLGDQPLPHLPWAVNKSMSVDVKDSIQKAMLSLNDSLEGKKILKKAGMTALHKAEDKDYDSSRKLIKEFKLIQ